MLTLKHLAINSFNENLAYIHRDCTAYKVDDIKSLTKVEIHGGVKPVLPFCRWLMTSGLSNRLNLL